MVLDLVIIGLAITLEPLTIVAFSLILGAERGLLKGLAFILGWTACLVVVIAAALLLTGGNRRGRTPRRPPRPWPSGRCSAACSSGSACASGTAWAGPASSRPG